ncbi:MAG: type II toxin-antitoxin system PemK/MazF family toxin [Acidobacteriaceae bacterium]
MPYEFGDVVLVSFPFTNQMTLKKRPAVVVSNKSYNASKRDVVIMAITSQVRASGAAGDLLINKWQEAGLLKPSAIKPVFATIEQGLIIRQLGCLDPRDQSDLRASIATILS